jgi:hypothetical protein
MKKHLAVSILALATALFVMYAWAAEINSLNTTDASNTARFPENMAPSAVNDSARALEGILARWHKDINGSLTSLGAADAYTVSANQTLTAYYDGLTIAFEVTAANTATATLNVDSVGAKEIKKWHDQGLVSGDLEAGQKIVVVYDSDSDVWQLLTPTAAGATANVITTRGDLIYGNSSAAAARLAIGAADRILSSDGTDVSWVAGPIGKHTVWVPSGAMRPTVSNGAASLADAETTAGRPDLNVLDFDASSDEHAQFSIAMPDNWNESTVTFQAHWTASAAVTTGVAWSLQCVSISDASSISAAYGTAIAITDDHGGSSGTLDITDESAAVTCAGTPASGDLTYFRIFRDVSDANDDMTQDARLLGAKLFYTIDAAVDQ